MDRKSTVDETNQVAEQMVEAIRESYRTIADSAVEIQERNVLFFESLFEAWNETLKGQAQTNRALVQSLAEQTDRQREALRKMVQESMGAHLEFLDSLFPHSRVSR